MKNKTSCAFKIFAGFITLFISLFFFCAYELTESHKQYGNFEHAYRLLAICILLGMLFAILLAFTLLYIYLKSKE